MVRVCLRLFEISPVYQVDIFFPIFILKFAVSSIVKLNNICFSCCPENPYEWTIDQVYEWAKDVIKLDDEDAKILRVNKVSGSVLLTLTKEELFKEPYKMSGGSATKLLMAVEKIKSFSGNQSRVSYTYTYTHTLSHTKH
jgi:hypothetical protein